MPPIVSQANPLKSIVDKHGIRVGENPPRIESLLRDAYPSDKAAVNCLMNAIRAGIPESIQRMGPESNQAALRGVLCERLRTTWSMEEGRAAWAVDAWFAALSNLKQKKQEPQQDPVPKVEPPPLSAARGRSDSEPHSEAKKPEPSGGTGVRGRIEAEVRGFKQQIRRNREMQKEPQIQRKWEKPKPVPRPVPGSAEETSLLVRAAGEIMGGKPGDAAAQSVAILKPRIRFRRADTMATQLTAQGVPWESSRVLLGYCLKSSAQEIFVSVCMLSGMVLLRTLFHLDQISVPVWFVAAAAVPFIFWAAFRDRRGRQLLGPYSQKSQAG
jgi:hypothetical protein